jgi:hypothetical protein
MNKPRVIYLVVGGLCILDLAAILLDASLPDLYLRPLILICMSATVLHLGLRNVSALLISAGLLAAGFVEVFQMLGTGFGWIAAGTALYYFAYAGAFILQGGRPEGRALIGFAGVAVYAIAMFLWLEPYGLLRFPSLLYTGVLILFAGLGLRPLLQGQAGQSAKWMAAAVVLLAFSDSLRAVSIFKTAIPESIVLAFYWCGQFAMVRSAELFSGKSQK